MTLLTLSALAIGCAEAPNSQRGFDADEPATRLYAITHAGLQHDKDKMTALVESLGSDDPAVRMMSIAALQRMTGTRLGYEPYDPPQVRQAAIDRWQKSLSEQASQAEQVSR